jgi:hypothetical protein
MSIGTRRSRQGPYKSSMTADTPETTPKDENHRINGEDHHGLALTDPKMNPT